MGFKMQLRGGHCNTRIGMLGHGPIDFRGGCRGSRAGPSRTGPLSALPRGSSHAVVPVAAGRAQECPAVSSG